MNSERCRNPVIRIRPPAEIDVFRVKLHPGSRISLYSHILFTSQVAKFVWRNMAKEDLEDTFKGKLNEIFTRVH